MRRGHQVALLKTKDSFLAPFQPLRPPVGSLQSCLFWFWRPLQRPNWSPPLSNLHDAFEKGVFSTLSGHNGDRTKDKLTFWSLFRCWSIWAERVLRPLLRSAYACWRSARINGCAGFETGTHRFCICTEKWNLKISDVIRRFSLNFLFKKFSGIIFTLIFTLTFICFYFFNFQTYFKCNFGYLAFHWIL